jgi:hypothetical protein
MICVYAEIGRGRWQSETIGDLLEDEARASFANQLQASAADTHVTESE